jgi:hypothetical protein
VAQRRSTATTTRIVCCHPGFRRALCANSSKKNVPLCRTCRLLGPDVPGCYTRARGGRSWSADVGQDIFQERSHGPRDPLRVRPGQDGTAQQGDKVPTHNLTHACAPQVCLCASVGLPPCGGSPGQLVDSPPRRQARGVLCVCGVHAAVIACVDCKEQLHSDEVLRWAQQVGDTEAAASWISASSPSSSMRCQTSAGVRTAAGWAKGTASGKGRQWLAAIATARPASATGACGTRARRATSMMPHSNKQSATKFCAPASSPAPSAARAF